MARRVRDDLKEARSYLREGSFRSAGWTVVAAGHRANAGRLSRKVRRLQRKADKLQEREARKKK